VLLQPLIAIPNRIERAGRLPGGARNDRAPGRYRNVCGETSCPRRGEPKAGRIGVDMDVNAVGFAAALPLFLVIAVSIAVWVQRMRG
jgi:hypothetical protein